MEPLVQMPILVPSILSLVLIFVSAFFIEKHYLARLALAGNVFFLWELLFPYWQQLPGLAQIYLNAGLVLAVLAIASRLINFHLPTEFYKYARILFGSISVLLVVLYFFNAGFKFQ